MKRIVYTIGAIIVLAPGAGLIGGILGAVIPGAIIGIIGSGIGDFDRLLPGLYIGAIIGAASAANW